MLFPRFAKKTSARTMKVMGAIMRVIRFRFIVMIGSAFLVIFGLHIWLSVWSASPTIEEIQRSDEAIEQSCHHPDLDYQNPLITKHIYDLGELECRREIDWVEVRKGVISINKIVVKRHGKIKCAITYLIREDDFSSRKGKVVHLSSDQGWVPLENDFFSVQCKSADKLTWKNIMAGVRRDEMAVSRARAAQAPEESLKLNVLMFGLDSMSRLHFMRKMPKTFSYLTKTLNATVLKSYNIVGDGTPQALIPILTGYAEPELPETRKRMRHANFVNVYPFAWKNFSESGYVTAFGEDCPYTGIFTYRLKGFNEIPTDHYLRSFYLEAEKVLKEHPKLCLGNTPRHKVMLSWLRQFYDAYSDVKKFGFCFHGELSHDDYNLVGYADTDVEDFLKGLHTDGILEDTLLIIMSDHGHRFASIRETQQGKQEERLPFFAIAVPPRMHTTHPTLVQNLRTNENRLVTPFDIHSTLMTLLHPQVPNVGDLSERSISVFSEIPKERTCTSAGIEPHWCACLSWINISPLQPIAREASQAVIDFINQLTESQRDQCQKLFLKKVLRVERLQPNKALLKFKKNADADGFVGDFTDNTKLTEVIYQVQLRAFPSDALYEASLKHDLVKNSFVVQEHELSRINMYGNQEHCIHDTYPNLRKYCFCKVQL